MKRVILSLGLLALMSPGCSLIDGPEFACTLVGCQNGLTVRFATPPSGLLRVEVYTQSPDRQPAYVYDCTVETCYDAVFFPDLILEHGFVRVTSSAGSRLTEIRPTYASRRPNGPDCPPLCRSASVTVPV